MLTVKRCEISERTRSSKEERIVVIVVGKVVFRGGGREGERETETSGEKGGNFPLKSSCSSVIQYKGIT